MFSLFVIVMVVGILSSILFYTIKNGIGPTPTIPKHKNLIIKELPSEIEGDIIDLGSGWGTMIFTLGKKYPKNQVIGYETSIIPYLVALIWKFLFGKSNVRLSYSDFWKEDLSGAGLIFCYLYPSAMEKLESKLDKELKKGVLVVSNTFFLPRREPYKTLIVKDLYRTRLFFYKFST